MNRGGQTARLRTIIDRPSFSDICQQQSVGNFLVQQYTQPENGNPHLPSTLGHALPCSSGGKPSSPSSPPSSVYCYHLQIPATSYPEPERPTHFTNHPSKHNPNPLVMDTECGTGISMSEVKLDHSSHLPLECFYRSIYGTFKLYFPIVPGVLEYLKSGSSAV
jgi:hypothetical protein